MNWTAIIPVRFGVPRKTRLAACLTPVQRERLADRLFTHVATVVRTHPWIATMIVLSPRRPPGSTGRWQRDEGRGLNAELEALRAGLGPCDLLVIHADLPLIAHDDISRLIRAAEEEGIAIAPDHRGEGTNALAIRRGCALGFAFGPGSLSAHRSGAAGAAPLVVSDGLAHDIDHPEDLAIVTRVRTLSG